MELELICDEVHISPAYGDSGLCLDIEAKESDIFRAICYKNPEKFTQILSRAPEVSMVLDAFDLESIADYIMANYSKEEVFKTFGNFAEYYEWKENSGCNLHS